MPESLDDVSDKAKQVGGKAKQLGQEKVHTCKEKIGYPFKVVGHTGAVVCCGRECEGPCRSPAVSSDLITCPRFARWLYGQYSAGKAYGVSSLLK